MASISGRAVRSLQGSVDGNAANLKDLTTDALDRVTVNRGRRTVERTRAGDDTARYEVVKGDPSVEFAFDVDPSADHAWAIFFNGAGPHAWDIKISDGGNNTGVHGSGVAVVEGPTMTINHADGVAQFTVTLRPAGADFAWDSDIS